MTIVYAESSAVLSWLLGEAMQDAVIAELARADQVVTSALTIVECARGLARARLAGRIEATEELAALRLLDEATAAWNVLDISDRVAERAAEPFPNEPVRTLDALHLASILAFADALGPVRVLSFDERVVQTARSLGMPVAALP